MKTTARPPIRVIRLVPIALVLGALVSPAISARADDDPFELFEELRAHAGFSCQDLKVSGEAIVDSSGAATGTAASEQGHLRSNADITLNGAVEVHGDVLAGPDGDVTINGGPLVTGTVGNADTLIQCQQVDLTALEAALDLTNDNHLIPLTALGVDVLGGSDGRELKITGTDTLTLPAGTYLFSSFEITGGATVEADGVVRILVTGDVKITGGSLVNAGASPYLLRLWSSGTKFRIESQSVVHGFIYAPAARTKITGGADILGAIYASSLELGGDARLTRIIDDIPPTVEIDSPADGATVSECEIEVTGTVTDDETGVTLSINGDDVDVEADGSFTATVSLWTDPPGRITTTAVDADGNETTVDVQVVVMPPTVTLVDPPPGSLVGVRVLELSGSAGTATEVSVNGVPTNVAGGVWRIAAFDLGVDGLKTLDIVGTNCAGDATATATLDLDTTPPVVAVADPTPDEIIPQATVTVTGTAVDAHLLSVVVNGVPATVSGDSFTAVGIPLPNEGVNTLTVTATDELTRTTTVQRSVIRDTLEPVVIISSPPDDAFSTEQPITVSGTFTEANLASLKVNGIAATIDGTQFTASVALTEGSNTITATAVDAVGHTGEAQVEVTLDTTAPGVTITDPVSGLVTDNSSITVSGSSTEMLSAATVDGIAATVSLDTFSAAGVPLDVEGENSITAVGFDLAGNSAESMPVVVVRDTLAPTVTMETAGLPSLTESAALVVTGTAVDPHLESVTVAGVAAMRSGDQWSVELTLVEGDNELVATAIDSLGHSASTAPITVSLDTQPPVIEITVPTDGAELAGTTVIVEGSVSDPHLDPATVLVNGTAATITGDVFSVSLVLAEGETSLVAQADDVLGHTGTSSPVVVTVDSLPPVVTLDDPPDTHVATPLVAVTGTVADPHLDQVAVNGVTAVVAGTDFTATDVALVEGSNLLEAVATDTFGHSATSNQIEIVLDTVPPTVAITSPTEGEILVAELVNVTGTVADTNLSGVEVNGLPAVVIGDTFTAENVPLLPGPNEIVAVARDAADITTSATVNVVFDTAPPAVAIVSPATGACLPSGQTVEVNGTVSSTFLTTVDGGGSVSLELEVLDSDGVTTTYPAVVEADDRSWSVNAVALGAADGTAILSATATDPAGRTGVAAGSVRIDATPPVLTLLLDGSPFPDAGAGPTPPPGAVPVLLNRVAGFRVSVADGAFGAPQPTLTLDGLAYLPGSPIELEGDHLVVAAATDCAGHTASVYALFTIDLTAPALLDTSPADGAQLTEGPGAYSGTVDGELAVATVNGAPAVVTGAAFSLSPITWREGENAVEVVLIDPAGNQATFNRSFTVSTIEPTVTIVDGGLPIPNNSVYTRAVTPEVRATPADATIAVTLDGAPFALGATIDSTGDYILEATATDSFGRTATDTVSFRVDLDAGPTIAITAPVDGAVLTEALVTVTGTVSGSSPTVSVNGVPAAVAGDTFTLADLALDPDVLNLITAIATDTAGRTVSVTVSVMVRSGGGQVLILEPVDGASTNRGAIDVVGVVVGGAHRSADGTVTVNTIVTPVALDGSFRTLDVPLIAGDNVLIAEVTDPEGRTDTDTVTVHTDLEPPAIVLSADGAPLDEGAVFTHPVTVTVTISDNMGEPPPPLVTLNGNPQPADAATVDVPVTADGGYLLGVTATDAAGNERLAERSFTITGGGCGLADLEPADGSPVAQAAVTLRGRSGSSESVTIRVPIPDTSPVAYNDYTANLADGTFVAGGVPLPAFGDNVLEIVCTGAGGATATEILTLHRLPDGDGPAVEITSPGEGELLSVRTIIVAGTVSESTAAVSINGRPATVTEQPDGSGVFTVDIPLTEGPNVIAARALDAAGRAGADRVIVWLDTRAPPVTITSPENNSWHGPRGDGSALVDVAGLVDLDSEPNLVDVVVSTAIGSVTAIVDPDTGAFLATDVPLDPAANPADLQTITVTATDTRGQTETASIGVHFDAAGPGILLTTPPDLGRYHEGSLPNLTVGGEAWAAEGSSISVNGATIDPTILTWDGPLADGRFHTTFSIDILRTTDEGPFGVIARVTQLDGRWAGTRRLLFVDNTAPETLEIHPADGSEGVDANSLLLVLFSEPVLHSSLTQPDGLSLTRLDTGDPVVGQLAVSGAAVAFVPGAAMAQGVDYRFRVGVDVTDLVGHPVTAPQEVVFTTATDAISTAPQIDPALPAVLCESSLTVAGTAAPNTTVRVRDGDLGFTGTADPTGAFSVTIPLAGDGYHVLEVAAVDRSGAAGSPTTVVVRVDCSGPRIELASLDATNSLITIQASEPIDPATATIGLPGAAIRLFDDNDPGAGDQDATVQVSPDGTTIELLLDSAPDAWWRDTVIRLVIGPPLADDNGIVMGAPFETLLFASGGGGFTGGFLFGETYDDTVGRPLAGATASLYPAGAALPGAVPAGTEDLPLAVATTDSRGRYQIIDEVAPGRYTLLLEADDHVRVVRQLSLEPATGAIPFDSRLTPMGGEAGTLDPIAGGTLTHPTTPLLQLTTNPAAVPLSENLTVHLVPRSGQGLPDALPLGWTPLAAADVVLTTSGGAVVADGYATPFEVNSVHLELPLPDWVVATDDLVAVHYHLAGGQWLTLADLEFFPGPGDVPMARVELAGPGSVAVVLPDTGDGAPPLPATGAGHPLRGVGLPDAMPDLTADLILTPPVVPPTGNAIATVVALSADGVTSWPSGLAVQAYLEEQLILAGGVEQLIEAPYVADLLLYRSRLDAAQLDGNDPESAGAVDFVVSPSERAAEVLLDVGYENIRLYPFPGQLDRGQILGPGGGTVSAADGVELTLPEGALPAKTVVRASLLPPDDLATLPAVPGYDTLAAIRVEFGGHTLARAATLSLDVPAGAPDAIAGDPRLILAELIEVPADGRGAYPELTARIDRAAIRLTAGPEAPDSGLAIDGVRREGLYLVLHAQASLAYATGFVTAANGFGIELARVTNDGLGTADLSALGGRYAVPIQAQPGTIVEAEHPASDEDGSAVVAAVTPDEIVALDIAIVPVPPTVLEVSPANGAVDQPVGIAPSVLFSEPLNPATVGPGTLTLVLADASGRPTGTRVAGSVSLNPDGTRIVFSPSLPLAPGRTWVAVFSGGVTDEGGTPYADGPVEWSFTTSTVVAPGGQVHPELFRIRMPIDGVAEIYGEPGALPTVAAGATPWSVSPWVLRTVSDPERDTFSEIDQGRFFGSVGHPPEYPVTIDDEVWVDVFDSDRNLAARFRFDVFSSPDGRGFVAPPGQAVSFTTSEGITVEVPEGAFDEPTVVTVTELNIEDVGVVAPTGLAIGAYIDVDFEGEANETLRVKVRAPEGIDPTAQVFIGEPTDYPWGKRIRMLSVGGVLVEGIDDRFLSNDPSLQPEPEPGGNLKDFGQGTWNCQDAIEEGLPQCFLQSLLYEFAHRSTAAFFYEQGAEWTVMAFGLTNFPMSVGFSNSVFYNFLADIFVYVPVAHDWSGHAILPVLENSPFKLVEKDVATGWILNEYDEIFVPENPDALFEHIEIDDENVKKPLLVGTYPFDFLRFAPPPPDERQELRLELAIETSGDGYTFSIVPNTTFELPEGTGISLLNTDPSENVDQHLGWLGPKQQIEEPMHLCADIHDTVFSRQFHASRQHVLIVGPGELDPDTIDSFRFQFDRGLDPEFGGIDSSDAAALLDYGSTSSCSSWSTPDEVPIEVTLGNNNSQIIITPVSRLTSGHNYVVELNAQAVTLPNDPDGYSYADWENRPLVRFPFATKPVPGNAVTDPMDDPLGAATDLMQFGNITMVSTFDGRIVAVDATSTTAGGDPGSYTQLAEYAGAAEQIRAFATDGHNRLFFNERIGGTWVTKTIAMEEVREAVAGVIQPVPGWVKTAYNIGGGSGTTASEWLALGAMPAGIPVDLEVLVQDEVGKGMELAEFAESYGAATVQGPDEEGIVTLELTLQSTNTTVNRETACPFECPSDRFQRVTVLNLTTGQSWSEDIENSWSIDNEGACIGTSPGAETFEVTARESDRLQVRHNIRTLGYLAIAGSGLTVIDLNRMYRHPIPIPVGFGGDQCQRRLGQYQGQDINFPGCVAGLRNGIDMTTSVAVIGKTGETDCEEQNSCRGATSVDAFSPLRGMNVVHSSATLERPADLSLGEEIVDCLDSVKTGMLFVEPPAPNPPYEKWVELPVMLRDIAIAKNVTWVEYGIRGSIDGLFQRIGSPTETEKTGDLLFVTLGDPGIYVFDISGRYVQGSLIGHLRIKDHSIHRLQVDAQRNLLFAGGYGPPGSVIQVWDIAAINGAPRQTCSDGVEVCPEDPGMPLQPLIVLENVPWTTNHLALDATGTGLLRTVDHRGVVAVPFTSPNLSFLGIFPPEGEQTDEPIPVAKPVRELVPLGIPMESSLQDEEENRAENDKNASTVVKLRVALPGSMGHEVTAKIQSLRVLPGERFIGRQDLGMAHAPYPGECGPSDEVVVTLRRIGLGEDDDDIDSSALTGETGPFSNGYDLYESYEQVVLIADPRAWTGYDRQDLADLDEQKETKIADEEGQCRRCTWPDFLPDIDSQDPDDIDELQRTKELLVTGPYLRAFVFAPDDCASPPTDREDPRFALCGNVTSDGVENAGFAIDFFDSQGDNYRAPGGAVEVPAWHDDVPSPIQVSLAEPVLNPAIWSPGEAGVSVSLVSGESMLSAADHSVAGRSMSFFMSRSYRSGLLTAGPLGPAGWTGRLFAHLREIPTTGEVEYHDGAGHVWRYYPIEKKESSDKDGAFYAVPDAYDTDSVYSGVDYIAPKGLYLDLDRSEAGGWRLIGRHNDTAIFDADGRLIELRDRHRGRDVDPETRGSTMYLTHDIYSRLTAVEDDYGRRYRLSYNEDPADDHYGLLRSVTDFADREIAYEYDDSARLESVLLPEVTLGAGNFVADDHPFEGHEDDGGDRPTLTYQYLEPDAEGGVPEDAVAAILHGCFARNRLEGFELPPFSVESDTGEGNLRARFSYHTDSGRVQDIGFPSGSEYSLWSIDQDAPPTDAAPANDAVVRAPWSHDWEYTIEDGRPKVILEELEIGTQMGVVPGIEAETSFQYDEDGNGMIASSDHPGGRNVVNTYNPTPGARRTYANLETVRINGPFGLAGHGPVVTTYGQNGDNLIDHITDAGERSIDIAVPAAEQSEVTTKFAASGPVETDVSASYDYDVFARVKKILGGGPDEVKAGGTGPSLNLTYGADHSGRAGGGLPRVAEQGNGLAHVFDYDHFDNLDSVTNQSTGAQSRAKYDEWDRPVSIVTGLGQGDPDLLLKPVGSGACPGTTVGGMFTDRAFDAAGHLVRERQCQDYVTADGIISGRWVETLYHYNRREQLVRVEKNNLATPGVAGEVDPETLFRTTLVLEHDDTGFLRRQTIPSGTVDGYDLVTTFAPDSSNRLSTVTVGNGATRIQGYDENGRVNFRSDGDAGTWFGEYDVLGRLYREYLPTGALIERIFDAAGNVLDESVKDAGTGALLSRTATYYTSFGAAALAVDFLAENPTEGDDLRITQRFFDSSGRTSAVRSGPAVDNNLPLDIFTLELDTDRDRRELQTVFEDHGNRPIRHLYGGCWSDSLVEDCPEEYREELSYSPSEGTIPWPYMIEVLERVPGLDEPALTSTTTFIRDLQGRPLTVSSSDGSLVRTWYDRLGGAIKTETGAGTVHLSVFDGRGLLMRQIRPSPRGSTAYAYDIDGRKLAEITQDEEGDELWSTTFQFRSDNNTRGLVSEINHPDGSEESFTYFGDDTVDRWVNRDQIAVDFIYDEANRPWMITPDLGSTVPSTMVALDGGDVTDYDVISRIESVDRGLSASQYRVAYPSYDLGGRPTAEVVGTRSPLSWEYDAFSRPTTVALPDGIGRDETDLFTGYGRSWDSLDRLTGLGGIDASGDPTTDLGADWIWGGAARLYGITSRGPLATAVRYGYIGGAGPELPQGSPEGALWKLGTLTYGAGNAGPTVASTHSWGAFGYGWRGNEGSPQDGMKIGRKVLPGGTGLLASMGWSWNLDNGLRLTNAHAGLGSFGQDDSEGSFETFSYLFEEGDQLVIMSRTTAPPVDFDHSPAPYGRIEARNGVLYDYDKSGRRTVDDRFAYRWDWRGRLYEVTVADDAGTLYDGHQVRYEYDALGRLHHRVHLGEDDGGNRPFIEYREYLWEGNGLLAEAGYGSHDGTWDDPDTDLFMRWRKSYVPGASGIDDAVQVRVQTVMPTVTDTTYSYLRDELGTVLGLVEEAAGADPEAPPVLVRYLYTPYGEVHAESGPELRNVVFDNDVTEVETASGTVVQTVDEPADFAAGVLEITLSMPADEASLAAGLQITEINADPFEEVDLILGVDYVIGRPEDDPATIQLLLFAGWERSHDYRVEFKTELVDTVGRVLVHERSFLWEIPAAGAVGSPPQPDLAPIYDAIVSASSNLGGAFPGGQTLLFQGLWTDPVTGIAYARNRWYDARTASWLSEDPKGAIDSPNLYAFVGWGPHVGRDPMGLAVYAFDGTWNDKDEMVNPTNVAKLYDAAERETPGSNEYLVGVGTNRVSKTPCGLTGCGASARVWRAYQALIRRYNEGDTEIDIFGFSRGAAEAREFANLIYREGIPDYSTGRTRKVYVEGRGVAEVTEYDRVHPDIRFLGLFDTVASMGVPGDDSNPGFDMSIPPNVRNVRQAIATNETRREFPLSSVIDLDNPDDPRIVERSFPGAHSDVGGGYEDNNIASRVPLMWMWEEAIAAGVPLAPLLREDTNLDSMGYYHDSRKSFDRFRDWLFGFNERGVYHYTNPPPERAHE